MKKRIGLAAQLRACRLLADLLAAGFTLAAGVQYLRVAMPKQRLVWDELAAQLAAGLELAAGLAAGGFHPLIVEQVALAAVHGQLATSLQHASAYLGMQVRNRRRLRQLMLYPAVLMVLLVSLQLTLWLGVLPSLQLTPQQSWRWQLAIVAGAVGGGVAVFFVSRRLPATVRYHLSQYLPGVRGLVRLYYQYQFMVGASQFLATGQDLVAYCRQLAGMPAAVLPLVGQKVVAALDEGVPLVDALRQPLIYPPAAELLRLGQSAALVQAGIGLFATNLFEQLTQRFERLLALVQPVMFLVIGGQIVWVYTDILGPLYQSVGY